MLWNVKKTARYLGMEFHQVYYLLVMGEIDAVKVGRVWRLDPKAVEEYAKRFPERTDRKSAGNFVYTGDGGFLFRAAPNCLPSNPLRPTAGMERRRRTMVHSTQRHQTVLFKELKSINQFELFTA